VYMVVNRPDHLDSASRVRCLSISSSANADLSSTNLRFKLGGVGTGLNMKMEGDMDEFMVRGE
jgi:hypothetical protein